VTAYSVVVWDDQIEHLKTMLEDPATVRMVDSWKVVPVSDLDPGIAPWVEKLRRHSVETFESCQGGAGHAYAEPTIRFSGGPGAGAHAYSVARTYDLPVDAVRRTWVETDGELTGPYWEIVFRRQANDSDKE
jgi:hypothetical protein